MLEGGIGFAWFASEVVENQRSRLSLRRSESRANFQRSSGGFALGFGFVCLEFEMTGCYAETDEVFVGEFDVIGALGRQLFGDELGFFGCG